MVTAMGETIEGVAILSDRGAMIALPRPCRHHHLFSLAAFMGVDPEPGLQGFVTSRGRFVTRKQALSIAYAANQPIRKSGNVSELYSEDLW